MTEWPCEPVDRRGAVVGVLPVRLCGAVLSALGLFGRQAGQANQKLLPSGTIIRPRCAPRLRVNSSCSGIGLHCATWDPIQRSISVYGTDVQL